MKKTLAASAAVLTAVGASLLTAPPAAADECVGGSSSGRCVKVLSTSVQTEVVESTVLANDSGISGSFTCGFSQTITRSVEQSASAEMSVSAQVAAVGASASVGVSESVSQSASSASSVAGTVTLAPGESVTCQRTYGSVRSVLQEYTYSGTGTNDGPQYVVVVPSSLGVRIV
ncbi:hypothetical protein DT076_08765 [Desertihabitans brevis]|uniref:DUF4333 domain-containing protein n=1 Tax=Desertihabitans brevis TaxID=2268447 RepID=A0A367YVZ9_9ACTN|nr:hypothetical protein [Desertihabitans brevis]RCK70075.1 hypothetical protein DT076_08765 [Desertihabitans brevis]